MSENKEEIRSLTCTDKKTKKKKTYKKQNKTNKKSKRKAPMKKKKLNSILIHQHIGRLNLYGVFRVHISEAVLNDLEPRLINTGQSKGFLIGELLSVLSRSSICWKSNMNKYVLDMMRNCVWWWDSSSGDQRMWSTPPMPLSLVPFDPKWKYQSRSHLLVE